MPIMNQVVQGGGGSSVNEPYVNWSVSGGKLVSTANHVMDFTGVKTLDVSMTKTYYGNTNITGAINMSDVIYINAPTSEMFGNCTGITSVDLSSLKELNATIGSMFEGSGITSIDLSSLEKWFISYKPFGTCLALTKLSLPKVLSVAGNLGMQELCVGCSNLITASFPSLYGCGYTSALQRAFAECTSLQSLWFYALTPISFANRTNQFGSMLYGCTNVTVHFPMAIQSTIGSWSDVTGGFGGTNTTVSFDIVTSLTGADGNTYTRSEKDSTATATAWTYNDTLYYTSGVSNNTAGVNEPSVSDAIYSDDACTTSVTTVTAIA